MVGPNELDPDFGLDRTRCSSQLADDSLDDLDIEATV